MYIDPIANHRIYYHFVQDCVFCVFVYFPQIKYIKYNINQYINHEYIPKI